MSKYTTEVRFICETVIGLKKSVGAAQIQSVVEQAAPLIFENYPIFSESYRSVLNEKILRHFYFREIGYETVALWAIQLNTRMREIMPLYNQMYKSELLEFNPLYDVDVERKHVLEGKDTHGETAEKTMGEDITGTTTSNTTGNTQDQTSTKETSEVTDDGRSTTSSDHMDKYSDTPQGVTYNLENDNYLTNARQIEDSGTQTSTATTTTDSDLDVASIVDTKTDSKGTSEQNRQSTAEEKRNLEIDKMENFIETVKGKQGGMTYSSMLKEFRDTFLNIDMLIINELSDLFMTIY